ncbi:MAG: hypothetical protein COV66_08260 [Nitrospinae bacterium CG11_big_fil_rev_8_21_14_0_20_45_15]|nr:MAG: hypothetical protein COV66_08260 [Nitrospinae bacterium CG11_big_fil_rev_8_21_14_0_20_45_15]
MYNKLLTTQEHILRYRNSAELQHSRFIQAWRQSNYPQVLIELHFLLVSINLVCNNMKVLSRLIGGDAITHEGSIDYSLYRDARNHFEHLDDRLFGSKRNAPEPVFDGANPRTIHYGLNVRGGKRIFSFGAKEIDVSEKFIKDFLEYVDSFNQYVPSSVDDILTFFSNKIEEE